MGVINESNIVKEQYKNSANLNTRISIHSKYSVNKMGFGNWIISNYIIKDGFRVLELGCGTGDMWVEHLDILDNVQELVLTDFSEGMLNSAKDNHKDVKNISYKVVDIMEIPFDDNSFDIVIANIMLYHVPNLEKALSEVKRVLKNEGVFYCATYGEHGINEYISSLLMNFEVEDITNENFTLQNGEEKLKSYFSFVDKLDYKDSLEVKNVDDIIDYVYSLTSMTNISGIKRDILKGILENEKVNGVLHIPKEYGMFVCKNI